MPKTKAKKPMLQNMKPYSRPGDAAGIVTDAQMSRIKKDRLKSWVSFYRRNPSFFVEHYMGVNLHLYQRFWLNLMARSTQFFAIASRASAKSWLIAVYSIARCILYPGTIVALASSTKAQAGLIISTKCQTLHDEHPNIQRETTHIVTNQNKWEMKFKNGSVINVVVSGEGGRGHRSNITVLEERRLIPNVIIDSIIRPFLVSRSAPYMSLPEYQMKPEVREEPQEIIITSAHYKAYEWYPEIKKLIRKMADGDADVKGLFLDYLISIRHGIKTKKQMKKERDTIDPITFLMEYGNIPFGSSSNSFYKIGFFTRDIKRTWRPSTTEMVVTGQKNPYDILKGHDEVRIVSVDVATRAGASNDNTIITCARLLPTRKGWMTEISYIESHNGQNTLSQALRIKQIFTEFQSDILVLDVANAGIGVYDSLTSLTKDEQRGMEYQAYTVMPDEHIDQKTYDDLSDRSLGKDGLPCIFPISASASLNSHIAVKLRERLKKKLIHFPVDDVEEEVFLIKAGNKEIMDAEDSARRAELLQAHLQATLMINEAIALEMTIVNGSIKLVEPVGARKDRFTSLAYLNYYVSLMDIGLLKMRDTSSDENTLLGLTIIR